MLAQRQAYSSLIAGLLLASTWLGSSGLAQSQRVPEAETAAQILVPAGATVINSRRLGSNQAEVLVEIKGQISPIVMEQVRPGQWQQDLRATLTQTAQDLQSTASQPLVAESVPAIGQTSESVLESARGASRLIPPVDIEAETQRAIQNAGRLDPFQPLNEVEVVEVSTLDPFEIPAPTILVPPPLQETILPPIPEIPVNAPPLPPPPALPTPTPDPAAFSKTVELTGIIQIDNESFAIVSAPGSNSTVVQTGGTYQSANVDTISSPNQAVVLSEGGQQVVKSIDASVVVEGGAQ